MRGNQNTVFQPKVLMAAVALVFLASCKQLPSAAPTDNSATEQQVRTGVIRRSTEEAASKDTGRINIVQWPVLIINGKEYRAAPGAKILNGNNLTVIPTSVAPNAPVRFELNGQGQVQTIRLLNALPANTGNANGSQVGPPQAQ